MVIKINAYLSERIIIIFVCIGIFLFKYAIRKNQLKIHLQFKVMQNYYIIGGKVLYTNVVTELLRPSKLMIKVLSSLVFCRLLKFTLNTKSILRRFYKKFNFV